MKKWLIFALLFWILAVPATATSIVAPSVPDDAQEVFPSDTENFGQGVLYILKEALSLERPQIRQSLKLCIGVVGAVIILSVLHGFQGQSKAVAELAGVVTVAALFVGNARSMIEMGTATVWEISEYGKLLLPVMTAALAAQGGGVTAAALYGTTALFDSLLCDVIATLLLPMVYIYLLLSIVNAVSEDGILKKLKDLCKSAMSWFFKLVLYLFTGYMTVTGVISGTADQTALKATKLTISGMIPVVGGILSDASETVLVGAGVVKNAVGVYGMLAVLAVSAAPFVALGANYLLLKMTMAISSAFAPKAVSGLLEDLSGCMGLILAMVGAVCLIQLISVVCFLKGMT